jgi:uncharacterized protein YdhG (YjbR/CyaY superfamily)
MAKTDFTSVDEYLASRPRDQRPLLQRIRAVLRKALPHADEVISYQIPAYKQDGKLVIFFAGWAEHFSLYPASEALVAAFADELAGYERSKGTIRFPLAGKLPDKLIARIAKFRAQEVAARAATKKAATKKAVTKKAATKKAVTKKAVTKKAATKKAVTKTRG